MPAIERKKIKPRKVNQLAEQSLQEYEINVAFERCVNLCYMIRINLYYPDEDLSYRSKYWL